MKLLANEIRVDKKEVRQPGSYNAIAGALHMSTKHEHLEKVPSFGPVWLPSPPLAETADPVVNPPQIFGGLYRPISTFFSIHTLPFPVLRKLSLSALPQLLSHTLQNA